MNNPTYSGLNIHARHIEHMRAHVQQNLPDEACGLLAAVGDISQAVYPITNQLRSPVRFFMEPRELLAALEAIDAHGWELQAVFHSHPNGPPAPSATDRREYSMPDIPALIWYRPRPALNPTEWACRAYIIHAESYQPLAFKVIE